MRGQGRKTVKLDYTVRTEGTVTANQMAFRGLERHSVVRSAHCTRTRMQTPALLRAQAMIPRLPTQKQNQTQTPAQVHLKEIELKSKTQEAPPGSGDTHAHTQSGREEETTEVKITQWKTILSL